MNEESNRRLLAYQKTLQATKMGLWEIDRQAQTVHLDESLISLFELGPSKTGKYPLADWYSRIYANDVEVFKTLLEAPSEENYSEMMMRINTKSKRNRFLRLRLCNGPKWSPTLVGTCWDATLEVLRKKDLIKTKIFLEKIMDAVPDPIFAKDKAHRVVFVNAKGAFFAEKTKQQMIGLTDFDLFPEHIAKNHWKTDDIIFQKAKPVEYEQQVLFPNGQVRDILTKKSLFQFNENEAFVVGIMRDITEKNGVDSRFRLMISLIDSSGDLFGFTDNDGVISYVNKLGKENLGIQIGEKHFTEYLAPNDKKVFIERVIPKLMRRERWQGEVTFISSTSGEEIPIWLHIFATAGHATEHLKKDDVFFAFTGSDLRQLKKIQSSLIGQSKMAALGEMAAEIAHEINNPLSIIQGKSQLMQEKALLGPITSEKLLKDLELIERNALRIQKIMNSSKALARKSEKDPYEFFSIVKIVEDSFEICKERFQKHHHLLTFEIRDKIEYTELVEVRNTEIIQVIVNLLNNAFDAIRNQESGWVKLILSKSKTNYQIEVVDSGDKIPADIAEKMMAPFFTTKPTGHGTGLGLSVSKQIAEAHGGEFYYDAKAPHTRFVICLNQSLRAKASSKKSNAIGS